MALPILKLLEIIYQILSLEIVKVAWTGARNHHHRIRWAVKTVILSVVVWFPVLAILIALILKGQVVFLEEGKIFLRTYPWLLENISFLTLVHGIIGAYWASVLIVLFSILAVTLKYRSRGELLKDETYRNTMDQLRSDVEISHSRITAVFNISPNVVCILDEHLVIKAVNISYEKLKKKFGLKDPIGRGFFTVFWFLADYHSEIIRQFECKEKKSLTVDIVIGRVTYPTEIMKIPVATGNVVRELVIYLIMDDEVTD